MKKIRNIFLGLLVLALLAFTAIFVIIPQLNYAPITHVYSNDFSSEISYALGKTEGEKALIEGVVKNREGRGIPALVRIFNKNRQPRWVDIVEQEYTNWQGEFSISVDPGDYEILIFKGPEYEYLWHDVSIDSGEKAAFSISLERIVNMAEKGWFAGDPHEHTNYSDGINSVEELLLSNLGVGLHWSVQTDHNHVDQNPHFKRVADSLNVDSDSGYKFLVIGGDEVTTSLGHHNVWEPKKDSVYYHIDHRLEADKESSMEQKEKEMTRLIADMKAYALFMNINHPFSGNKIHDITEEMRGDTWMDVQYDWVENKDVILNFDATESWNGGSGFMTGMYYFGSDARHPFENMEKVFHEWYRLLNTGAHFPSLGSSDTHNNKASGYISSYNKLVSEVRKNFWGMLPYIPTKTAYKLFDDIEGALMYQEMDLVEYGLEEIGLIPGSPRTYIYTGGELSAVKLAENVGKSFITSGPLLVATINDAMPGETVEVTGMDKLNLDVISHKPLKKLMLIANGELILEKSYDDVMQINEEIEVDLKAYDWAIVYVEGNNNYAYAYTNPVYFVH